MQESRYKEEKAKGKEGKHGNVSKCQKMKKKKKRKKDWFIASKSYQKSKISYIFIRRQKYSPWQMFYAVR